MLNTNEKIIKHKVGLLNLAEALGIASKACKVMGYRAIPFIDTSLLLNKALLD